MCCCVWPILYVYHHRPELAAVVGLKGCVKGFQFQKKDFNLLEEPGTIGISSGCPEESFVSSPSSPSGISTTQYTKLSHSQTRLRTHKPSLLIERKSLAAF